MPSPLDLTAEITDSNGTVYRWGASETAAEDRLKNLSFSTKIGEGFSSAQGQLARRIDLDYPDLNLVDNVAFVGVDGSVAWEGRISALPRELSDAHSVGVTLTGWMSHAKDRKFTEVYVDRDLNAWGPPSLARKAAILALNIAPEDPSQSVDPTNSQAGVTTGYQGPWASPYKRTSEAWYDAGSGNLVAKVFTAWKRSGPGIALPDANWTWSVVGSNDAIGSSTVSSGNLNAAGPSSLTLTVAPPRRYALLSLGAYAATPAGVSGATYGIDWYNIAVYGDHGLTTYTGEPGQPDGVLASDVVIDVARRFCPKLNVSGVRASDLVIQHLTFKDLTDPYDAFLEVNKYHLWNLAVWENRRLAFEPYDLRDYDWEIRTDDPGTTFSPQGPSVDDLAGGIMVIYTDAITGLKTTLSPEDFPNDLVDPDPTNPWTTHGVQRWITIELSTPTIQTQALQIGRAALADRNTPKTPGTITVQGYIRDRQGNEQPVWKIRAGDTISVTNFPNDSPRLIVETNYDDEQKQISLSIDRPFALLDAYIDRVNTAIGAKGLS